MLSKREVLNQYPSARTGGGHQTEVEGQPEGLKQSNWPKEKARRQLSHDWRQNGEKRWRDKQRTSPPEAMVFKLARAEEPTGGSQSARSSDEVGNDHGARGRRKVNA